MVGKMKHLKLDKHGEMAGGHNPQQVSQRAPFYLLAVGYMLDFSDYGVCV
jgi:hypothetical protein